MNIQINMRPVVLYRNCNSPKDDQAEKDAIEAAGFDIIKSRMEIKKGDFVICRYSAVPFYKELAEDIAYVGAKLINSYAQHQYIANLRDWVLDLGEMTFETWDQLDKLPNEGSFVLKGATNSKKFEWNTHMFAEDKQAAIEVYGRLCADGLIAYQEIFIRRYVPLKRYFTGIKDLPISKEFRFFIYNQQILCGGFYWSSHADDLDVVPSSEEVPRGFLYEAIRRIGTKAMFYCMDVAQTEAGDWIVVELNDGQQAGPSENDLNLLYPRLKTLVAK